MSDSPHPISAQRTMLVVDDQHGVCVSLSFLLSGAGYRVITAESGRAAIAFLDSELIDGAIIDVHMPGMNGFETCVALQTRSSTLGRQLHVWFMTGAFTKVLERRCMEVGGIGVLHKPFEFPDTLMQLEAGFAVPPPTPPPPQPAPSCVALDDSNKRSTS